MRPALWELLQTDTSKMIQEELRLHAARLHSWRTKDFQQMLADETEGRPEHQGFIYVLSHESMPGLLKIGFTSGPVDKRAGEIGRPTGVPGPFTVESNFPVYSSPKEVEQKVHRALSFCRVNDRREFFRVSVEEALPIIRAVLNGTFDPP